MNRTWDNEHFANSNLMMSCGGTVAPMLLIQLVASLEVIARHVRIIGLRVGLQVGLRVGLGCFKNKEWVAQAMEGESHFFILKVATLFIEIKNFTS